MNKVILLVLLASLAFSLTETVLTQQAGCFDMDGNFVCIKPTPISSLQVKLLENIYCASTNAVQSQYMREEMDIGCYAQGEIVVQKKINFDVGEISGTSWKKSTTIENTKEFILEPGYVAILKFDPQIISRTNCILDAEQSDEDIFRYNCGQKGDVLEINSILGFQDEDPIFVVSEMKLTNTFDFFTRNWIYLILLAIGIFLIYSIIARKRH